MRLLPHLIIVILLLGWIDGGRGLKVIYYFEFYGLHRFNIHGHVEL